MKEQYEKQQEEQDEQHELVEDKNLLAELKELVKRMTQIGAPTGQEQKRAAYVLQYLQQAGAHPVQDEAGNILVEISGEASAIDQTDGIGKKTKDTTLVVAHLDTVFQDLNPEVSETKEILKAPGVGDDTANVAILMYYIKNVIRTKRKFSDRVLFAFDVGEEGLGNLKGIRQIVHDHGDRIRQVIGLDLTYRSVCCKAVGSKRYRVHITTCGGHSFNAFGNTNAIERAAAIVTKIYNIDTAQAKNKMGNPCKMTYNVGMINGGTSVNAIAQECDLMVEVRADDSFAMEQMDHHLQEIFRKAGEYEQTTITWKLIGDRPSMGAVDIEHQKALTELAAQIIFDETGIDAIRKSGSTDCNIPLSMGIPAVCTGGYEGEGTHTREEWIRISSLTHGYHIFSRLIGSVSAYRSKE